jgi:DNA-binding transcriptional regulator YdaS (Cro superfamily)
MDFDTPEQVAQLIQRAGGHTKLARRMGFSQSSGKQRIENWRRNVKIPPMVCKAYSQLFNRIMSSESLTA